MPRTSVDPLSPGDVPAPDPVQRPGAHMVHRRLAAHRHQQPDPNGSRTAGVETAMAIRDCAAQLDADAAALARKLHNLTECAATLRAGGRLTAARASTPLATLGAEIDLLVHSIDLGKQALTRHLDTWTHLQPRTGH